MKKPISLCKLRTREIQGIKFAENEEWKKQNLELAYECAAQRKWLDRICKPVREWLKTIPPVSKSWDEHKMGYAFKAVDTIQEYLDSQKPSEKPVLTTDILNETISKIKKDGKDPRYCRPKSCGIYHSDEFDCPICNPPKCEYKNKKAE